MSNNDPHLKQLRAYKAGQEETATQRRAEQLKQEALLAEQQRQQVINAIKKSVPATLQLLERTGKASYELAEEVPFYNWEPEQKRVQGWMGLIGVREVVGWKPRQTGAMVGWQLYASQSTFDVSYEVRGWESDIIHNKYGIMSTAYLLSDGRIYSAIMRGFNPNVYDGSNSLKAHNIIKFSPSNDYYYQSHDLLNPGRDVSTVTTADIDDWQIANALPIYEGLKALQSKVTRLANPVQQPTDLEP